jgi:hypothetical protein
MNPLLKADDYIIDCFQNVYDYVWDKFGVTKGVLIMLLKFSMALVMFIDTSTNFYWRVFWVLFFVMGACGSYFNTHVPQTKGDLNKINSKTLYMRKRDIQSVKVYVLCPILMGFVLYNIGLNNYHYVAVLLMIYINFYLITLLVKEREPDNFNFSFDH